MHGGGEGPGQFVADATLFCPPPTPAGGSAILDCGGAKVAECGESALNTACTDQKRPFFCTLP